MGSRLAPLLRRLFQCSLKLLTFPALLKHTTLRFLKVMIIRNRTAVFQFLTQLLLWKPSKLSFLINCPWFSEVKDNAATAKMDYYLIIQPVIHWLAFYIPDQITIEKHIWSQLISLRLSTKFGTKVIWTDSSHMCSSWLPRSRQSFLDKRIISAWDDWILCPVNYCEYLPQDSLHMLTTFTLSMKDFVSSASNPIHFFTNDSSLSFAFLPQF